MNHPVKRLEAYLNSLKSLVSAIDLEAQVYREGTNAGQIAFHASQAANFWLWVRILQKEFVRDRELELTKPHSLGKINESIDKALTACEELKSKEIDLNIKLKEAVAMKDFTIDSVGAGLIFITSHTAEHVAELTMLRDYVSTLK